MVDINCNGEMRGYHDDEVTLPNAEQKEMRKRRDNGRIRLDSGLTEAKHPLPKIKASQGSYQMRTMVQDDDADYDIDDGVYFAKNDLKDGEDKLLTPLAARTRICDALKWDGRLKYEAEIKDNCVRQYYPTGYHVDVPVYRIQITKNESDEDVETYELASGDEWRLSDARKVTKWFNDIVGELNAGVSDGSQMRRLVKLTKKFARSRNDWKNKTCSGICITKLVRDNFNAVENRDDKALRMTWGALKKQLDKTTAITHPLDGVDDLAHQNDTEVGFFRDCLTTELKRLEALDKDGCDRDLVRKTWDEVFDTDYFSECPDPGDEGNGGNDGGNGGGGGKASVVVASSEKVQRNDNGGRFG